MNLPWAEIARVLGAPPTQSGPERVSGWSIDTRTLEPGDLFFALHGPNHDGHDHVPSAFERGAAGAVVEKNTGGGPLLVVDDTFASLQRLAAWARREWGGRVVGVTGSAGKTTTKDMIAHLLSAAIPTGRTTGNFNNHVGVPLSILRLPDESRVAVLEMGMNHAGEIRALAAIARPEVGVVTNVGHAHAEFFESIEGVAAAKRELIESLPPDGTAVLNADDARVAAFAKVHPGPVVTYGLEANADVRPESVERSGAGVKFRVRGVEYESAAGGRHNLANWMAALAVAQVCEIPFDHLRDAVAQFRTGKMRCERVEHRGMVIWNDCYNANPEAMKSMLDVLGETPGRRKIAVLGEMLELGRSAEPLHREVGCYVAEHGIDVLVGVHGAARFMVDEAVRAGMSGGAAHFFEDPEAAGQFVRSLAREGDAILFKGSRGVRVERALEQLLGEEGK